MITNVAIQVALSSLCLWQLSRNPVDNTNVHRTVVWLVVVHTISSLFCVLMYRIPQKQISKAAHYVGCVPSIGRLHRRRFSFFCASATASLLFFLCTRTARNVAIVWSGLYVLAAAGTLLHCHRWYTFAAYLIGACTVAVVFFVEAVTKENVVSTWFVVN